MSLPDATSRRLGARFLALREHRRVSQAILASAAGISRSAVISAEGGQSQVTLRVLTRLSSALGVDSAEMLRSESPDGECFCGNSNCILRFPPSPWELEIVSARQRVG